MYRRKKKQVKMQIYRNVGVSMCDVSVFGRKLMSSLGAKIPYAYRKILVSRAVKSKNTLPEWILYSSPSGGKIMIVLFLALCSVVRLLCKYLSTMLHVFISLQNSFECNSAACKLVTLLVTVLQFRLQASIGSHLLHCFNLRTFYNIKCT
jgi:hypothetical protein